MRVPAVLLSSGLLLAGCRPCRLAPADSGAADSDTAASTDDTSDWTPAACPAYAGLTGSSWTWEGTSYYSLRETMSVTTLTDETLEVHGEATITSNGATNLSTVEARYRCDAHGLWMVDSNGDGVTTLPTGETQLFRGLTIYDPPPLIVPAGLTVGSTWDTRYAGLRSDGASYGDFDYTIHNEVVAADTVTVPAGEFATLHVVKTHDGGDPGNEWWDATAGLVKGDFIELVDYQP
jgi:hypothetical protein